MSFRKEEKLHIHESQLLNLLNWLYKNDGYKLYDTRTVSSTYFDNDNMQMFKDSEEGCVPRKKIRIRSYSRKEHKIDKSTFVHNCIANKNKSNISHFENIYNK